MIIKEEQGVNDIKIDTKIEKYSDSINMMFRFYFLLQK
jgi:hypothetical protein